MQRIHRFMFVGLMALLCGCDAATIVGDGQMSDREYPLQPLQSIKISGNYNVLIQQGSHNKAVVHTDNNIQDHVSLDQDGRQLNIHSDGSFKLSQPTSITLTVTQLADLDISGNNTLTVTGLATPALQIELSGHQQLSLTGKARQLKIKASGDNQLNAKNFIAQNVTLVTTGHSIMQVFCQKGDLAIQAQGDHQITYFGKPRHIQQQTAGNVRVIPA